MTQKEEVREEILNLLKLFIGNIQENIQEVIKDPDQLLKLIITDSRHAINFIVLLEDEFNIEIDDDNINHVFFESIDKITDIIYPKVNS
jgi:acyl carrier protein